MCLEMDSFLCLFGKWIELYTHPVLGEVSSQPLTTPVGARQSGLCDISVSAAAELVDFA